MKKYNLKFQGYTWDEYFFVIANKPGLVVVYKGGLDSEGAIRLDNIIYVDGADEIGQVYESKKLKDIRKKYQTLTGSFSPTQK